MALRLMKLAYLIFVVILLVGFSPLGAAAQGSPDGVVTSFLENWKNHNYEAMYNLVAERSRNLTAFPVFETIYRESDTAIGMEDMTFTVRDVSIQGTSAAVTYDLTIQSGIFETIEDTGRIMRLVQGPGGWGVAWSSMDIFDGMTGAARLQLSGLREPRAAIYDRNGLPVVAQEGEVVALYVQLQQIPNQEWCLDLMANLLRRQRQDLVALFERYNLDTVFYVGEIDADVYAAREVELRDNCAVRTAERTTRHYYRGNAVSHVTGYIGQLPADQLAEWEARGYTSGDLVGRTGIELAAEEQLAGKPARRLQIIDPAGIVIRELGATVATPPMPVTLTIDRALQVEVSQALADAFNYAEGNWGNRNISTGAAAIVMDVNTGGILAMSSYPLFEPDIFNPDTLCCGFIAASDRIAELVGDTRTPLFNRVIQGQYSPGSIYKIVTTAAVVEEGLLPPDTIFDCTHTWDGTRFGDTVGFQRTDWTVMDDLPPTGPVTISQALTSSCDPFFYEMGARLFNERGPSVLVEYSRRMGLGRPTGINYYGTEAGGQLTVPNSPSEAINNAIGQGDVQVTPIQFAALVAGIANGGTLYKPYLIQKIGGVDFTPVTFEAQPEVVGDMGLSEETLAVVHQGMCDVTTVPDLGTAETAFRGAAYIACGKTGTSQTNRYPNAWFVAYAPAENPQIAVVVLGEQSREGSEVAAPIVRRIMDFYFNQPWNGYPLWWNENSYVPLNIPEGATGG
jgi:penicillin-binding protein 2